MNHTFAYVPSSHLDLYWLGSYRTCLERGAALIKDYLDRCLASQDETFLLETVVFADYFLERHPDYRESLLQLVREGRLEIGAVYVDRWEHLILGESHVRNIQIGAAWSQALMGRPNALATHPDLPGLVAQTSQIYAQAGIRYYVTSRKVFEDGAVWQHRAPDGTNLIYLNWPKHYIYYPLNSNDLPTQFDWIREGIDAEASARAFTRGVIPVNGGAGDLTDPADFRDRYGASLQELIAANREKYPEYDFGYTIPSAVLEPYEHDANLPVIEGEIPSVWGVACDEEVVFFRRNRETEYRLLAAETMAVLLEHLGEPPMPATREPWQGRFYESAFYARKDPIAPGHELAELWKMHIFTEDHNGGGYEGALSTFQKRVMQERVFEYATQILDHALGRIGARIDGASSGVLAFNALGQQWSGSLTVDVPSAAWESGMRPVDAHAAPLPVQVQPSSDVPDGATRVVIAVSDIPSIGYHHIAFAKRDAVPSKSAIEAIETETSLSLVSSRVELMVDRVTGTVTKLLDRHLGADWGRPEVGELRAVRESGNDVTLRMASDAEVAESKLCAVTFDQIGPVYGSIRIEREILGNTVAQVVSLWHDGRVEFETRVRWSGAHNWQLRLALPTTGTSDGIAYGSPFHGSSWTGITAEAAPRNGDEILAEDYGRYREIQEWLHLRTGDAGLLQVTTHPGFCFIDRGLEAVLLRTSPSCGDTRYFWENAGEQVYRFGWFPIGADWRAEGAIARAQRHLRPPVSTWIEPGGDGDLPSEQGFLSVSPASALLSSLSRNVEFGDIDIRVFESTGFGADIALAGTLLSTEPVAVDLRGLPVNGASFPFRLPAWRIQTFALHPRS
jgi:alpha-mannosidase